MFKQKTKKNLKFKKEEKLVVVKPTICGSGVKPITRYAAILKKLKEELKIIHKKDVCVRLRITSPNFINSKNLNLTDYVNPSNNRHLKEGDCVLACRWKLGAICFRNEDGTKSLYHLNGNSSVILRDNAHYIVETLFKKSLDGRSGLRVCFNGYDFYKILKDLEYIELIPNEIINPNDYKVLDLKEFKNDSSEKINKKNKKIDCGLSEEQLRKLDTIKNSFGYSSLADVIRKLINEYKI